MNLNNTSAEREEAFMIAEASKEKFLSTIELEALPGSHPSVMAAGNPLTVVCWFTDHQYKLVREEHYQDSSWSKKYECTLCHRLLDKGGMGTYDYSI